MDKAVSGFASCGICPLDPGKFTRDFITFKRSHNTALPFVDDEHVEQVQETSTEINEPEHGISFKELVPVPGPSGLQQKEGKRKKQHSEIITSSPMKETLVIAEKKRKCVVRLKKN